MNLLQSRRLYCRFLNAYLLFLILCFYVDVTYASKQEKIYKVGQPIVKGLMYVNELGEPSGFPFEIVLALTRDENINIEWVKGTWPELYQKLIDGEIDILPGTQITEERTVYFDFLKSSLYTMWSELYLNNNERFEGLSDLKNKKIALVKNDNNSVGFINYIKGFNIDFQPVYFFSHADAVEALHKGDVYAMAGPASILLGDLYAGLNKSKLYFNPTDLNIAFKKNKNLDLQKKLNNRLEIYKQNFNSPYHKLVKRYGLANYSHDNYRLPLWTRYFIVLLLILVVVGLSFLYLLRKQVEKKTLQLKERQVMLEKALALGKMGIWTYDYATKQLNWSDEVYYIHRLFPHNKLSFFEMMNVFYEEDKQNAQQTLRQCFEEKKAFSAEFRILLPSGEIAYTKQIAVIDKNEKGDAVKVIGVIQDITQDKEIQEDLIESKNKAEESDRLKTQFLNNMSHEIRTPMNGIVGFAGLLDLPNISDEKRKSYTAIIRNSSNKLLSIIDSIIEMSVLSSKSVQIEYEAFNLNELLFELLETYRSKAYEKRIQTVLNLYFNDNESVIISDVDKLNKILNYIIDNAFKFTTTGYVEIGYTNKNSVLEFWVKDTGIGISKEYQQYVFNNFSQASKEISFTYGGLGLGLAIAKHYTLLFNGTIRVESTEGCGSTFYLTIPYTKGEFQISKEIVNNTSEDDLITILIAEDEDINYVYLETVLDDLSDKNIQIIRAVNGKEAVNVCASNSMINMVLMDIKMPVMDGFEATRQIRKNNSTIPIIAQTAFTSDEDKRIALESGCNEFISKPISIDRLVQIIDLYFPEKKNAKSA